MTRRHSTTFARGFTLIEVMLALLIFGVLSVLAYRATAAMSDSEARLTQEASRWRSLEAFFGRFEADIRAAIPRESRLGASAEPPWLATTNAAGEGSLVFTRAAGQFGSESDVGQRLGYRLRDGAIEIAYWPHLDNPAGTTPTIYTLTQDIAALRIDYLGESGTWRTRWPLLGEPAIPRAVRLAVTLRSGEAIERLFALR